MADERISVYNTVSKKYGVVDRYIFEHPVYGQYMVLAEEAPCDCGPDEEVPAVEETIEDVADEVTYEIEDDE